MASTSSASFSGNHNGVPEKIYIFGGCGTKSYCNASITTLKLGFHHENSENLLQSSQLYSSNFSCNSFIKIDEEDHCCGEKEEET